MRQNDERRQEEHNLPQQAQTNRNRRLADGLEVVERQDVDGDQRKRRHDDADAATAHRHERRRLVEASDEIRREREKNDRRTAADDDSRNQRRLIGLPNTPPILRSEIITDDWLHALRKTEQRRDEDEIHRQHDAPAGDAVVRKLLRRRIRIEATVCGDIDGA